LTQTVQATTDATGALGLNAVTVGTARTTKFEYNTLGQLTKVIGPRTDLADVTLYDYDPANGNLIKVTNALGHVTTLSGYDARGKVGSVRRPDGVTVNMSYTQRGQLETQTVTDGTKSQLTSYYYNEVDKLTSVTLPDQSSIRYTYDDANRLTDITDSSGNAIHYVLDNNGNRTSETIRDPDGNLARQITRAFDTMGRLKSITGGNQ
jgi:YD repeat-containing protein